MKTADMTWRKFQKYNVQPDRAQQLGLKRELGKVVESVGMANADSLPEPNHKPDQAKLMNLIDQDKYMLVNMMTLAERISDVNFTALLQNFVADTMSDMVSMRACSQLDGL